MQILEHLRDVIQKYKVVKAFVTDIFFNDQDVHLKGISKETPSAKVEYKC